MSTINQEMNEALHDVMALKNLVVENWDDILKTADQIEKLIRDGLLWLEDEANIQKAMDALKTDLPDIDFENPIPEDLLKDALKPIQDQLDKIDFTKDLNPAQLVDLVKDQFKDVDVPGIPGFDLDTLKRIVELLMDGGLELALKDLEKNVQGGAGEGGEMNSRTDGKTPDELPNPESDGERTKDINGMLDALTKGFSNHFEQVLNKHQKTIESIIDKIANQVTSETISSFQSHFEPLQKQVESGKLNMEDLVSLMATMAKDEGQNATQLLKSLQIALSTEISTLKKIAEDAFTERIELPHDLQEIWKLLSANNLQNRKDLGLPEQPDILAAISLIVAFPLSIILKITGTSLENILPTSKQAEEEDARLIVGGSFHLVKLLTALFKNLGSLGCYDRINHLKSLVNAICDFINLAISWVAFGLSIPEIDFGEWHDEALWGFGLFVSIFISIELIFSYAFKFKKRHDEDSGKLLKEVDDRLNRIMPDGFLEDLQALEQQVKKHLEIINKELTDFSQYKKGAEQLKSIKLRVESWERQIPFETFPIYALNDCSQLLTKIHNSSGFKTGIIRNKELETAKRNNELLLSNIEIFRQIVTYHRNFKSYTKQNLTNRSQIISLQETCKQLKADCQDGLRPIRSPTTIQGLNIPNDSGEIDFLILNKYKEPEVKEIKEQLIQAYDKICKIYGVHFLAIDLKDEEKELITRLATRIREVRGKRLKIKLNALMNSLSFKKAHLSSDYVEKLVFPFLWNSSALVGLVLNSYAWITSKPNEINDLLKPNLISIPLMGFVNSLLDLCSYSDKRLEKPVIVSQSLVTTVIRGFAGSTYIQVGKHP